MPSMRDRLLLSIEEFPLNILYRAAIGFSLLPIYLWCVAHLQLVDSTSLLLVFVAAVLIALRIVPGLLRRLVPASREVRTVWAERRQAAQAFDSFQWRKLLGLGLGWLAQLSFTHNTRFDALALAISFVLAGGAGQLIWIRINKSHLAEFSP
jgi:hypothetical protein